MKIISSEKNKYSFWILIVAVAILPYLLYGFRYFPILDDYIQYGCYPAYGDLSYIYFSIGTVATRPLASLLDPAFWGQFWPMMGIALCSITAMHIFSAMLFSSALKKYGFALSPLFLLIYLLFPLGMEGRYWLSASTRIITGLFFASIALWFAAKFCEEKQSLICFLLFFVFQLISCGFYESVAVFSVSATVLLFCISFYKSKKKSLFLVPLSSVLNISLMFLYYRIFAGLSSFGSRTESAGLDAIPQKIVEMLRQVFQAFSQLYNAVIKGCVLGIKLLLQNGLWGIFVLLLIILLCFLLSRRTKNHAPATKTPSVCLMVCGIILFFAPLLPNVLAADVWITNRSIFVSIIGLALILEGFWNLFHKKHCKKIIIFCLAFLFITASVNEYDTYKRAAELDDALLTQIAAQLEDDVLTGKKNLQVVLPEEIKVSQNAFFKDHVKSVFDSDWALTGALRAKTKTLSIKYAEPVLGGNEALKENCQTIMVTHLP